jgi:predicted RNA-binding Zn ribbon-like protein
MASHQESAQHVELVRSFVNTVAVDEGNDVLDSAEDFSAWLREGGFVDQATAAAAVSRTDLALARDLRTVLREMLRGHHGDRSRVLPVGVDTARISAQVPLRLDISADPPHLVPAGEGVRAALGEVMAAVAGLPATEWERLKICPADDCQWAFYDTSRNRSRRWCSMEVCGNRAKVRAYRSRS